MGVPQLGPNPHDYPPYQGPGLLERARGVVRGVADFFDPFAPEHHPANKRPLVPLVPEAAPPGGPAAPNVSLAPPVPQIPPGFAVPPPGRTLVIPSEEPNRTPQEIFTLQFFEKKAAGAIAGVPLNFAHNKIFGSIEGQGKVPSVGEKLKVFRALADIRAGKAVTDEARAARSALLLRFAKFTAASVAAGHVIETTEAAAGEEASIARQEAARLLGELFARGQITPLTAQEISNARAALGGDLEARAFRGGFDLTAAANAVAFAAQNAAALLALAPVPAFGMIANRANDGSGIVQVWPMDLRDP